MGLPVWSQSCPLPLCHTPLTSAKIPASEVGSPPTRMPSLPRWGSDTWRWTALLPRSSLPLDWLPPLSQAALLHRCSRPAQAPTPHAGLPALLIRDRTSVRQKEVAAWLLLLSLRNTEKLVLDVQKRSFNYPQLLGKYQPRSHLYRWRIFIPLLIILVQIRFLISHLSLLFVVVFHLFIVKRIDFSPFRFLTFLLSIQSPPSSIMFLYFNFFSKFDPVL